VKVAFSDAAAKTTMLPLTVGDAAGADADGAAADGVDGVEADVVDVVP
jgi:hypothetical protein